MQSSLSFESQLQALFRRFEIAADAIRKRESYIIKNLKQL